VQTKSINGNKYFISFIDDLTGFTILYFQKKKLGAYNAFTSYKENVENQCRMKLLYFALPMEENISILNGPSQNGIRHEHTISYNPQQNDVAERKNHTLLDVS
jgi:hypothetical protein